MLRVVVILITMILTLFFITGCGSEEQTAAFELNGEGCLVLLYHRVLPQNLINESNQRYTMSAEDFYDQMQFLTDNGITFITPPQLEEIVKQQNYVPGKYAVVTFDDVDDSVYTYAYPILQQFNIPFTLFVITGQTGNDNYMGLNLISWDQIRELTSSGLAVVGTHSHNLHFQDSEGKSPFLNPTNIDVFREDLTLSMAVYEQQLGYRPDYFAYPYGFGIPETDQVLLNNGFRLVFALRPGIVQPGDNSFFIRRVEVTDSNWPYIIEWVFKT